jgi:hypothetical protein
MLVTIWMILLISRKRIKEFFFGLFGFGVVFFTDEVLWFHLQKTRIIEAPIDPNLFLLYFSFTYGMIMFSYAPLMFNKKVPNWEKTAWSILMYGGWLTIALLSQSIAWNDTEISIGRNMANARLGQILMAVIGYSALVALKLLKWRYLQNVSWWYFGYLLAVGFFIHFSMESTLWIAAIRPSYIEILIFNSLVEFNMGIPILFFMWIIFTREDYKPQFHLRKPLAFYYQQRVEQTLRQ